MAEATAVQQDGISHLVLRGEVDVADYETLDAELRRLEERGPRLIAIDLREVDYIDSTGLRLLVEANERARGSGRRLLVVHGPGAGVTRILQMCHLDEVLDLIESAAPARA